MKLQFLALLALLALWLLAGAAALVKAVEQSKQAHACAAASYGTDAAIARCYRDNGLEPPANYDARED